MATIVDAENAGSAVSAAATSGSRTVLGDRKNLSESTATTASVKTKIKISKAVVKVEPSVAGIKAPELVAPAVSARPSVLSKVSPQFLDDLRALIEAFAEDAMADRNVDGVSGDKEGGKEAAGADAAPISSTVAEIEPSIPSAAVASANADALKASLSIPLPLLPEREEEEHVQVQERENDAVAPKVAVKEETEAGKEAATATTTAKKKAKKKGRTSGGSVSFATPAKTSRPASRSAAFAAAVAAGPATPYSSRSAGRGEGAVVAGVLHSASKAASVSSISSISSISSTSSSFGTPGKAAAGAGRWARVKSRPSPAVRLTRSALKVGIGRVTLLYFPFLCFALSLFLSPCPSSSCF